MMIIHTAGFLKTTYTLHDAVTVHFLAPKKTGLNDHVASISLTGIPMRSMKDSLRLFAPIVHDVVETADKKKMNYQKDYVLDDEVFKLRKDYALSGNSNVRLDRGRMLKLVIPTENFDGFQYKGKPASTLYVSGNSWIGFGENSEHLKIVRRDTDLMTLRREEGTIWGTYKFLRIRWEGYSVHGNRIEATRMIWDAILFDTGEICVSFDTIPTNSSYLADSSLVTGDGTIAFTALTGKIISFKPKDESGNSFEYMDHAPVFRDPYNRRYLISDADSALYTVEGNVLVKLEETELTAELFETRGVQDIPDEKLLITLHDPTILYWHDSENLFPDMKVIYTGVPIPQVLYSENIDISDSTILGIEKVAADCSDEVLFAVSFDNGASWWSCINAVWARLSEEKSGMSKAALEAISVDSWAEKATTGQLKYRFIISGTDGYLKSITTDYLNTEE